MHPTAERFVEVVEECYDISPEVHEFPDGTKTAKDAAAAVGCDVAQIGSSLVFVADGDPIVVVTSGANRVDEGRLAALLAAADVRMANPDEVKAATGWSIGGVPPFAHDEALQVLVDETLTRYDTIWVAAGTPRGVFPIDPAVVVELSGGRVADVAE